MAGISVVINTLNEEKNIARAINSIKWVDEIIVCDMHSGDKTIEIAKKLGAKVFLHKQVEYVEPARNFAISKATNNWILILDADEEIPESLALEIKKMMSKGIKSDFVEIPRKNIIFDKWIQHSGWWPDYQVRFFKKGSVIWSSDIHSKPKTDGLGLTLQAEENFAIIHNNYRTVDQFIQRMNRYSEVEARELTSNKYKFHWTDILTKPLDEFLSRFFAREGYKDGIHGLTLALLQAFSELVVYLKVWEKTKFKEEEISIKDMDQQKAEASRKINYWLEKNTKMSFLKKVFK